MGALIAGPRLKPGTVVYAVYDRGDTLRLQAAVITRVTPTAYWLKGLDDAGNISRYGTGLAFHCKTRWARDMPDLQDTKAGAWEQYSLGVSGHVVVPKTQP